MVDPYAGSALRASSRPLTPLVAPGGLRGAPQFPVGDAPAKWAAAALRGNFHPQDRGMAGPGGVAGQAPQEAFVPDMFAIRVSHQDDISDDGACCWLHRVGSPWG